MNKKNKPTLLRYLIHNIEKGNLPAQDMLADIQSDLGTEWSGDINIALLKLIGEPRGLVSAQVVPQHTSPVEQPLQAVSAAPPKRAVKPKISKTQALSPGDLGRGSIIQRRTDD